MVNKRRSLLDYLKKKDVERYNALIPLGLRVSTSLAALLWGVFDVTCENSGCQSADGSGAGTKSPDRTGTASPAAKPRGQ
jgi:hypothetical protein